MAAGPSDSRNLVVVVVVVVGEGRRIGTARCRTVGVAVVESGAGAGVQLALGVDGIAPPLRSLRSVYMAGVLRCLLRRLWSWRMVRWSARWSRCCW